MGDAAAPAMPRESEQAGTGEMEPAGPSGAPAPVTATVLTTSPSDGSGAASGTAPTPEPGSVTGDWQLTVSTPRGPQSVSLTLRTEGELLVGELEGGPISDVREDHGTVKFRAMLSEPFPVNIRVQATVEGDTIRGSAKASMFPIGLSFTGARR